MSTKKWDDLTEDEQWEWFDKVREQYDEDEVGPQEAWRLAEQLFNYENPDDEDEVL